MDRSYNLLLKVHYNRFSRDFEDNFSIDYHLLLNDHFPLDYPLRARYFSNDFKRNLNSLPLDH